MNFDVHIERWQARSPFRISGKVFDYFESVVVELEQDDVLGRGEGLGIFYEGETAEGIVAQVLSIEDEIRNGIDRQDLLALLPHGGARHVLDQALWDLEAKSTGRSIFELTGVEPRKVVTDYTIGIEPTPEDMADRAKAAADNSVLKIKLDEHLSVERVRAVREARPDATILVDANQGWSFDQLCELAPQLAELDVVMIEQPLPRGADHDLESYDSPVPLCADESCLHMGDLDTVVPRYQFINIKLDKTGGLTHALELARAAKERGLRLMVGCMGGSSLAMAPAYVIACLTEFADIDGPQWLRSDRVNGLEYKGTHVEAFKPELWG